MADKPKPQRVQPRSNSPMADPDGSGPVTPAKKNAPTRKPPAKAAPAETKKPVLEPQDRERMLSDNQLETLRLQEAEQAAAEPEAAPEADRRPSTDRVPFGNHVSKMDVPEREGFTRRWFNDKPGRIQRALKAGYKMVDDPHTKAPYVLIVNQSASQHEAQKAYCMEIPNEYYDEDFALKQEALDFIDRAIYTGKNNEQPGDKRYVPPDTMKFQVKRGPGSQIA